MWPPGPPAQSAVSVDSEDKAPFELRTSLDQRWGGRGDAVKVTDIAPDSREFSELPGGPGVKTPACSLQRGAGGPIPGQGTRDPKCHMVQTKTKKSQNFLLVRTQRTQNSLMAG